MVACDGVRGKVSVASPEASEIFLSLALVPQTDFCPASREALLASWRLSVYALLLSVNDSFHL